ncbi:MAG: N-acetyltransferase [Candidatus Diapherotrites archaeon]
MTDVKIRKATLNDLDEVAILAKEMWDFHEPFPPQFIKLKKNASKIFRGFCRKIIKGNKGFILVAEHKKELVGYLLEYEKEWPPIYENNITANVFDLYVRDCLRNKGIGTKLLKDAEKRIKKKYKFYTLDVAFENKRTYKFYKKMNFIEERIRLIKKL